jgi:hypothetical protein
METNIKYRYSVYTQMKDEDKLLPFFIDHYMKLGFEHIYIVDDNSDKPIIEIGYIQEFILSGKITVLSLDYRIEDFLEKSEKFVFSKFYDVELLNILDSQTYLMRYFIKNYKNINKYVMFCDADEYLYIKNQDTIHDLIEFYRERYSDMACIHFFWVMFGSSYHIDFPETGHLFENFQLSNKKISTHTKYILDVSVNNKYNVFIHRCFIDDGSYCLKPDSDELIYTQDFENRYFKLISSNNHRIQVNDMNAYIAHYAHCSIYETIRRRTRKNANNVCRLKNLRNTILSYNQARNTDMVEKYCSERTVLDETRFEANKMIDINTYNKDYGTNFLLSSVVELILDSKMSNRKIHFITLDEFLPVGFNVVQYKKLNPDLQKLSDIDAKLHYIKLGNNENRKYKVDNL